MSGLWAVRYCEGDDSGPRLVHVVIFVADAVLFYRAQCIGVSAKLILGALPQFLSFDPVPLFDLHHVPVDFFVRLIFYVNQRGEWVYLDGELALRVGFELLQARLETASCSVTVDLIGDDKGRKERDRYQGALPYGGHRSAPFLPSHALSGGGHVGLAATQIRPRLPAPSDQARTAAWIDVC